MSHQTFLVGSGSQNIYACRLTANGQLQLLLENKSGKAPSWLLARNDLLYAVNEQDDKIETFTIDDRLQGKLTSKNTISAKGSTPCSLDIDPSGQWLAVAKSVFLKLYSLIDVILVTAEMVHLILLYYH